MENAINIANLREQRSIIIKNIKDAIEILKIEASEIFAKPVINKGAVNMCSVILDGNPAISWGDFVREATSRGVNIHTARCQYSRLKKKKGIE